MPITRQNDMGTTIYTPPEERESNKLDLAMKRLQTAGAQRGEVDAEKRRKRLAQLTRKKRSLGAQGELLSEADEDEYNDLRRTS